TSDVARILQQASEETIAQFGGDSIKRGSFSLVGEGARGHGPSAGPAAAGSHLATVEVGLVGSEERDFSSQAFADAWRAKLPPIPGVEALTISAASGPGAGKAVDVQL